MAASPTLTRLQQRLYPTPESRDPVLQFLHLLYDSVRPSDRVLEIGAGAGKRNIHSLRGRCSEIVGVDVDPRVTGNPLLDRGLVADAEELPFADGSFDVAFAIYVLEHIENPRAFVAETKRVLRPGGHFLTLVPNQLHYVPILSKIAPTWFHRWCNRKRGRRKSDTFPTFYRLNSRTALLRYFTEVGFEAVYMRGIEVQPNYLTFSIPFFLVGVAYERIVNSSPRFEGLRVNIACVLRLRESVRFEVR